MKKDWLLLDAKRIFLEEVDFIIETIGIYSNFKLMELACAILLKSIFYPRIIKRKYDLIYDAPDTMENFILLN